MFCRNCLKIAVRNSISLLGLANVRNTDDFASLLYMLLL